MQNIVYSFATMYALCVFALCGLQYCIPSSEGHIYLFCLYVDNINVLTLRVRVGAETKSPPYKIDSMNQKVN